MGRKRSFPAVAFLRTFNEGEKLTEEQKEWLLNTHTKPYIRTKEDSTQKCPYCGKQFCFSSNRYMEQARKGYCTIICKGCGETFYVRRDRSVFTTRYEQ